MEKVLEVMLWILMVGTALLIILGVISIAQEIVTKNKCYNLPITEFFKDSKCEKYVEDLKK